MYNENVDLMEGYKQAKFERFCLNSIREKGDIKKMADKEICELFPLNMCEYQK